MNLKQAIRQAAAIPGFEPYAVSGTVVDVSDRVVEVEPLNGSANFPAQLQATPGADSGFVVIPTKGSFVVAVFLGPANAFVVGFSDFDVIELGGSENGNVAIITKMADEIQKLTDQINAIRNALSSAPVVPADGGAAFKAGIVASISAVPFIPPNFTDETVGNEKVKH
jgi:hypothetical protein